MIKSRTTKNQNSRQSNYLYFVVFIFLLNSPIAKSLASIPNLTTTDVLQKRGLYFGEQGFIIHIENTPWFQLDSSKIKSKTINAEYQSLDDENPTKMTVRAEQLNKKLQLHQYIKKSVKDYRRFGFKILDLRPIKINQYNAFIIDLNKIDDDLQLRQILFTKNQNVVILTCTGHRFKFQKDLTSCNQIARNFSWIK